MTADEETNERLNNGGTRHAVQVANALAARPPAPHVVRRRRRPLRGHVHRGHVRRGPASRPPVPPDEVRVRAHRARGVRGAVARLPAGDGARPLPDGRDGQDRRAVLPVPRAQARRPGCPGSCRCSARGWGRRTSCRSTSSPTRWTHIAHQPGLDGRAFHLVNPEPQPTVDLLNVFARIAGAPRITGVLPPRRDERRAPGAGRRPAARLDSASRRACSTTPTSPPASTRRRRPRRSRARHRRAADRGLRRGPLALLGGAPQPVGHGAALRQSVRFGGSINPKAHVSG